MTQYIEFDEVISKSATDTIYGSQPLGDIVAIGRGGKPMNSGHVHYQCEEPGYIMGLSLGIRFHLMLVYADHPLFASLNRSRFLVSSQPSV